MLDGRLSRLSLNLLLVILAPQITAFAQQKANDFTKRLDFIENKQSKLSGRFFNSRKLSDAYNRRIKIEEWPTKFSPFGGKRFTTKDIHGLIKSRVPFPEKIEIQPARVPGVVINDENRAPRSKSQ